ncbi:MAG: uroporphyrinogen decarboxylase family protein [Candidatus Hydrogenedentes bacterium]|nr:uroporphyrinogen decarboxylase family protein [Candidatus Hydrogenedentota bacterium]
MTGRERVLALIEGRQPDCLPFMPITMMFAADFAGVPYGHYAADHRVLADAQVRVAEAFDFDYVSAISDPAREAADCGAAIVYFDNQPPAIDEVHARLANKTNLANLRVPDPLGGGRMHDRVNAISLLKQRVGKEKLVEGWIEGPVAEAADLRGINTLMTDLYEDPEFVRDLFEFVLEMELQFARAQIRAGADIIGMGDAAASLVGPDIYNQYVWPYEKRMVDGVHALGGRVRLHICGHTAPILGGMGRLGCEIVDLDWPAPFDAARAAMGPRQVLLGNIDPVALLRNGTPEAVTAAIADCHQKAGSNYIVSAGCEVVRDTPHENVRAMHDYARSQRGYA